MTAGVRRSYLSLESVRRRISQPSRLRAGVWRQLPGLYETDDDACDDRNDDGDNRARAPDVTEMLRLKWKETAV